ncbi:conjugal transfer protein [Peribacillus sp. NPDC096622]|uniref:conjugal transfer protein n=1 Tax=Peribacillus sp. NPDC096622 TaxID=3364396 RepID=UPI00380A4915
MKIQKFLGMMNKPKDSKPKKPKIKKDFSPKRINSRKYVKYSIYLLVAFWTVGAIRGYTADDNSTKPVEITQKATVENFATTIGAENFASKFVNEYFKWNKDDFQEREKRLQPYLREGMDEQAGLRFDTITGNAFLDTSELWKIEETGKDTAEFTFKVTYKVKKTEERDVKNGKRTKKVTEEKDNGPYERWIKVPIITDGKSFLINGNPTFTSKPEKAKIKPLETKPESAAADQKTAAEINKFLQTFFKQYSTGTAAELEYLTTDKSIQPLGGTIVFESIEELRILENKKKSSIVEVNAIFTDSNSKVQILQKYTLEVLESSDNKWQVTKFN